ncbi:MAG: hypothetical protein EA353_14740 [Puniceicoccaceae bacterium]|nr:MAG: hypothetical protein EA353_14740 [Puniceicoccaceae bacterium]
MRMLEIVIMIVDFLLLTGFLVFGFLMLRHLKPGIEWYSLSAYLALYDSEKLDPDGIVYRRVFLIFACLNIIARVI